MKTERETQILELLTKEEKIEVTELSERFHVSLVTIRKDLTSLEKKGLVKRGHGYASLANRNDINGRLAYHYDLKKRIAYKAASYVKDGETIMIESGSCCALLADVLMEEKKYLTIITNSAFIANYVRNNHHRAKGNTIVLLGGEYQDDSQALVGPLLKTTVANFYVDSLFIGTDGYIDQIGFTNSNLMRAQAVRDMAQQARHVIVLTESEKFSQHGDIPLNLNHKIDHVITDDHMPEDLYDSLKDEMTIDLITN